MTDRTEESEAQPVFLVFPWAAVIDRALEAHEKQLEGLRKEWSINQPLDEYGRPLNPSVSRI